MGFKVLLIDDDEEVGRSLLACLSHRFIDELDCAYTADEAFAKLRAREYDLVLLDMFLAKEAPTGLDMMGRLKSLCPNAAIVMLTSYLDQTTAVRARTYGALDYITKSLDDMPRVMERIDALLSTRAKMVSVSHEARQLASSLGFAFVSTAMEKVLTLALKAHAMPKVDVLIRGETGTGKEAIAEIVGRRRDDYPFVTLNCATLAPTLIESELFGHQKGAFTGSVASRMGLLQVANGGDLFLDEVDSLSLEAQSPSGKGRYPASLPSRLRARLERDATFEGFS